MESVVSRQWSVVILVQRLLLWSPLFRPSLSLSVSLGFSLAVVCCMWLCVACGLVLLVGLCCLWMCVVGWFELMVGLCRRSVCVVGGNVPIVASCCGCVCVDGGVVLWVGL